jgi:hypothetical protein
VSRGTAAINSIIIGMEISLSLCLPLAEDKDIGHAFQSFENASSHLETKEEPAYSHHQVLVLPLGPSNAY